MYTPSGVDHIGHTYDRTYPLMGVKLEEMDQLAYKVIQHYQQKFMDTGEHALFMLFGDHGMKYMCQLFYS